MSDSNIALKYLAGEQTIWQHLPTPVPVSMIGWPNKSEPNLSKSERERDIVKICISCCPMFGSDLQTKTKNTHKHKVETLVCFRSQVSETVSACCQLSSLGPATAHELFAHNCLPVFSRQLNQRDMLRPFGAGGGGCVMNARPIHNVQDNNKLCPSWTPQQCRPRSSARLVPDRVIYSHSPSLSNIIIILRLSASLSGQVEERAGTNRCHSLKFLSTDISDKNLVPVA